MVFVVKSALTSNNLRKAIRYTWGNVKVYNEVMFETVFVIGDTTDETMKKSIAKENYLHGDILQLHLNERQKYEWLTPEMSANLLLKSHLEPLKGGEVFSQFRFSTITNQIFHYTRFITLKRGTSLRG